MIWPPVILIAMMLLALATAKARADDCRGNPDALGTSRLITVDPRQFPRIGTVQYSQSLPLADKEVVLTFDDGPLPPYTNRVLDLMAKQCVKATYFLVGRMARGYPHLVRRIQAEGHTIGTHSENHMLGFDRAPMNAVQGEIDQGIASVAGVLGNPRALAPFFRIPGFLRRQEVEAYLQSRGLMTWSADVVADDWKHVSASEIVRRSIARLEERGKGILLLHDIQPATALALPELFRELKAKGYRIVQVVPGRTTSPVPMAENKPDPAAEPPAATATLPSPKPRDDGAEAKAQPDIAKPAAAEVAKPAVLDVAAKPAVPAEATESLARAELVPQDPPVRPFTSGAKPARNMSTPGKFLTTEPGGWPPVVSVPVPHAGGIGVSPVAGAGQVREGRFQ